MTNTQDIIDDTFSRIVNIYNAQPVVMDYGQGSYAYDTDGKKYLDFAIGIAVASLGHANPKMLATINTQAARLMACQASYATIEKKRATDILIENSCFDLVYFSNSGTESVEAALKCARKWAYDKKGEHCNEIIAFDGAFHGRTYGSASITYKAKSQPFFGPYVGNVKFATFNDLESVIKLVSDNTAMIIVEPVQGEGGLVPANPCFLQGLRALCDKHDICLIFDEIQAGAGRLGTFFAYESFKCCADPDNCTPETGTVIEPDIITMAKGMGGGFPVGVMLAKQEFGQSLVVGTHGTTYGGNPLACAVAATVMEEIMSDGFLDHANKMSKRLITGLKEIQRRTNQISDIRGMGLMVGVDIVPDIKPFMLALQKNGMMATVAGKQTLRLTPALNVSAEEIDEALEKIETTLTSM